MGGGAAILVGVAAFAAFDAGAPAPRPSAPSLLLSPSRDGGASSDRDRGYDLRPAKDGTGDLVYEGTAFTARIARDGTARFIDKGAQLSKGWRLIPFIPLPLPGGTPSLQGVVTDLLARRHPQARAKPNGEPPPDPPLPVPNMSRYRPDPREVCQPGTPCFFEGNERPRTVPVTGTFDLTDELMRLDGQDPYRRDKALFLAETRDLRAGMAARALATDVRRAMGELVARLSAIACDERRSVAERRAVIQALRGELDGNTPAAREAVATISRFLATRFDADGGARCPAP
jgi:hypothetical protein